MMHAQVLFDAMAQPETFIAGTLDDFDRQLLQAFAQRLGRALVGP